MLIQRTNVPCLALELKAVFERLQQAERSGLPPDAIRKLEEQAAEQGLKTVWKVSWECCIVLTLASLKHRHGPSFSGRQTGSGICRARGMRQGAVRSSCIPREKESAGCCSSDDGRGKNRLLA
jgi:hypothetical protein